VPAESARHLPQRPPEVMRIWDLPTRLFHWLLVALFAFSWWSAENREMEWHYRSGLTLLALLLFRLLWGLFGGSTARFAWFVTSPAEVLLYLRGRKDTDRIGHNPLGGYSVVAMLLMLFGQVTTGLLATDVDGLESGPLSFLVDFDQGRQAAELHEACFTVLLVLIGIHVLAVLFYLLVRKRNLVRAMVTGYDGQVSKAGQGVVKAPAWRFALAAAAAGAGAWATAHGFWL